jgi:hypothetical protein
MNFTQYKQSKGTRETVTIPMPPHIEQQVQELTKAGWQFEIEILPNGNIYMDCCTPDIQLANALCPNGPQVPLKVQELVETAHQRWTEQGKPHA